MAAPLQWMINLFDGLSGPSQKIVASLEKIDGAMGKTAKATSGFESGLTKLSSGINVARTAFGVLEGVARSAVGILETVGENAATQGIFEDILGKEQGAGILKWLGDVRNSTAFTRDQLENLAQPLTEFFQGDDLKKVIVAGLDVGRGNLERTSQALDTFAKVASTGKISSKAFKTLGLIGPEFAKLTGGDAGEASITTARLLSMIAGKNASGQLGDRAIQSSQTVGARLNQLRGAPGELWEKLADSKALPLITKAIGDFTDKLTSPRVLTAIASVFEKVGNGLPMFLDKLAEVVEKTDWTAVANGISTILNLLAKFGFGAAESVGKVAAPTVHEAGSTGEFLSRMRTSFVEFLPQAVVGRMIAGMFSNGDEAGKAINAGMVAGMSSTATDVHMAAVDVANAASGGVVETLEIKSPSRVMERLGRYVSEGFALGIGKGAPVIDSAFANAFAVDDVAASSRFNARGGGSSLSIGDIIVNIPAEMARDAQSIGEAVRDQVRALLDEYAIEGA